jgi:ATP/maltotriose-dependent transcriptional regulator MalT/DNA-binding SARP family transcriptional activator
MATRVRRRAASAKLLPPAAATSALRRPVLESRLDEAFGKRLTTIVAGAGLGKSTLLAAWTRDVQCAWYTVTAEDAVVAVFARGIDDALRLAVPQLPENLGGVVEATRGSEEEELGRADAFAALLCETLAEHLEHDLVLVLDDVHELGSAAASARLLEGLCRQAPPTIHLVLASRAEPGFPIARLRGRGEVLELDAGSLAFTADEVRELLASSIDAETAGLADAIHEATEGWPAAVRLAVEALRAAPLAGRPSALERVRRPEGPLFSYLADEVFSREPPEVREFLRRVAPLEGFTVELCEHLGVDQAGAVIGQLSRRGLFVHHEGGEDERYSLHALVRDFARRSWPLSEDELRDVLSRAAAWYEQRGDPTEELRCLEAANDGAAVARFLRTRGPVLLAAGAADSIVRAADLVPPELRDADLELLAGQARQIRGDWEGALACYGRAGAGAEQLRPAIAWRMGVIHYLRGELEQALAVYERALTDGGEPHEEAMLYAWAATTHWVRGAVDVARGLAERALATATSVSDDQGLAAAHTSLAMVSSSEGDRVATYDHDRLALAHAERAGDVLQIIRVRTNHGSHLADESRHEEALAELEAALRLADLAGFETFRALGLSNRGEARLRLGRVDEAIADLESSRKLFQRLESGRVTYPLGHLGDAYRERSDLASARAAYEEVLSIAGESGDVQALVPALAGLARVLAADEPEQAAELVQRALSYGPGLGHVAASLAAGWLALVREQPGEAAARAEQAAAAARERRDRAGLAESIELTVLASTEPGRELGRLDEAIQIWRAIGNPVGEARAGLALSRLTRDPATRALAARYERRLQTLGVRTRPPLAAGTLALLPVEQHAPAAIQTLGVFRLLREGHAVAASSWQSKKARQLLKLLVARRGRPAARDVLMHALWPEEDPDRLGNRLSVALATIRSVLDPEKRYPPDHFVAADAHAAGLVVAHLAIDIETFLAQARAGLRADAEHRLDEAEALLEAAEAGYTGDFLEEDLYEDWAAPLREEARAAYVGVARALARLADRRGDDEAAVRYRLRILERDRYDEGAHLGLVAALARTGRHGDARRRYGAYTATLQELDLEPAPFPST